VDEESVGKGKHKSSFRENLLNTPDDFNDENQSFQRVGEHDDNDIDNDNLSKGKGRC
jgi:hypothetical protein